MRGLFINLDRSPDRRLKMEKQLATLGLADSYKRFSAVDGRSASRRSTSSKLSDGEVAIFKSHLDVIQSVDGTAGYTHVLEDDALISPWLKPYLAYAEKLGLLSLNDLIFLEFGLRPDLFSFKYLIDASQRAFGKPPAQRSPSDFNLIDVRGHYAMGTASYIINHKAVPKILALLQAEWLAGPRMAIDLYLRKLIQDGQIKAGAVLPFLTAIGIEETIATESGRKDNETLMAVTAITRQSFYIDRELTYLTEMTDRLVQPTPKSEHQALLYRLAGFFRW